MWAVLAAQRGLPGAAAAAGQPPAWQGMPNAATQAQLQAMLVQQQMAANAKAKAAKALKPGGVEDNTPAGKKRKQVRRTGDLNAQ